MSEKEREIRRKFNELPATETICCNCLNSIGGYSPMCYCVSKRKWVIDKLRVDARKEQGNE